jgi:hypothetical protein
MSDDARIELTVEVLDTPAAPCPADSDPEVTAEFDRFLGRLGVRYLIIAW